ncbi:hypothetical protein BGW37DRAFT_518048 [Umbelopsis sp. PMI_123]|nr:hypothetical protein BGW37DRAFT_518048 [Umbelopsis sp. PMI_123]
MVTVQQQTPPPPPYVPAMDQEQDDIENLAEAVKQNSHLVSAISKTGRSLDRKSIIQGIKLVAIAADEYNEGNDTVALDIYLTGLDKIVMALPAKEDLKTKMALEAKLISVEERVGILDAETKEKYILAAQAFGHDERYRIHSDQDTQINRFRRFAQYIIELAIALAIMIKQSPLPDILYFLFGSFVQLLLWMDAKYHLVEQTRDLTVSGVKLILKVDEDYNLHQVASETMYMVIAAGLKAAVAFKESPSYQELKQQQQDKSELTN